MGVKSWGGGETTKEATRSKYKRKPLLQSPTLSFLGSTTKDKEGQVEHNKNQEREEDTSILLYSNSIVIWSSVQWSLQ